MKRINILVIGLLFLALINPVSAYKYTEEDKEMFYNAFLDGYFAEIEKAVNNLNIEQSKKENYILAIKANTNKKSLEDTSWECIKKYPIQQIVAASVICTAPWTDKQAEINKKLFSNLD